MKKLSLLSRFEVGITFIPFLILILLVGQYKLFFTYFLITFIHEMGHVIVASVFNVRVNRVKLDIFGFNADIDNIDYLKWYKQISIILAGPLTYFISLYLIKEFYLSDTISLVTYYKALSTNLYVLVFNLLPIYPLDGGRIIRIIFNKLFTFKLSKILLYSVSFVFMILFVFYTMNCKQYLMYLFLSINFILNVLNLNKDWKRFLLNRIYINNTYKAKMHHRRDLYMYNNNYLLINNNLFDEKEAVVELLKKHGQAMLKTKDKNLSISKKVFK